MIKRNSLWMNLFFILSWLLIISLLYFWRFWKAKELIDYS